MSRVVHNSTFFSFLFFFFLFFFFLAKTPKGLETYVRRMQALAHSFLESFILRYSFVLSLAWLYLDALTLSTGLALVLESSLPAPGTRCAANRWDEHGALGSL